MMHRMPGTNLTRDEAATRGALLSVDSYTIDLDLTVSDKVFESTTVIRFSCSEPGASTFADLHGATVHEITLNGRALDPFEVYRDQRIQLDDLAADNELRVFCELPYSHTGEGLHRFVDPVDQRVYLYTQFEVPDARRVYTTFEQPDLKSVFTFTVTAPEHWTVVSNSPTPEPEGLGERQGGLAVRADRADVDVHHRARRRRVPRGLRRPTSASTAPSRWATSAASRSRSTSTTRRST